MMQQAMLGRCCRHAAIVSFVILSTSVATAQTWTGARTTPSLSELVAVDATGETNFPFGNEDVAGDGATFGAGEQAVDIRSGYAMTDTARLWLRAYVSATTAPDPSLRWFVFIDADRDVATGGSADAGEIDVEFTTDPTTGGYDHVLGVAGDATVIGFWNYNDAMGSFVDNMGGATRADTEVGVDFDPLRFGADDHGYLQGSIELGDVALTASCGADLFFRALSDVGNDSDVGMRVACTPGDTDGDGVPNVVETVGCSSDADCPANGVCVSGDCVYPAACVDDGDCGANQTCVDGSCVSTGGQSCDTNADCDGLLCSSGACEPCNNTGAACPSGQTCGSDGRCIEGSTGGAEGGAAALVDPDEEVQGGAFTCAFSHRAGGAAWLFALGLIALGARRRRAA